MTEIVDRTASVYADQAVPQSVRDGKNAILGLLDCSERSKFVKKIEFLENFGLNVAETARAGAPRYTGFVVSLHPDFELTSADAAWLNGLYGESVQLFPTTESGSNVNNFVALAATHMFPSDSHAVAGFYQMSSQDAVTGEIDHQNYVIVNASAADESRRLVNQWTSTGQTIKDAYESAATEKYVGVKSGASELEPQMCSGAVADGASMHDNLKAFTENRILNLSRKFTKLPAEKSAQTSNVFLRGKDCVHYLNGAVAATNTDGALCLVSPLHGYVRYKKTLDRTFFPSHLLSSDRYVDVTKLNDKQRNSIFERAVWPSHTTCNAFALRKPIHNWKEVMPQPADVYRMAKANFALDTEVHRCLPTSAVLAMTPLPTTRNESSRFPAHVKEGKIQVADTDRLCAQLLSLRHAFTNTHILNPAFYNDKKPGVLELPRDLAETLAGM